jgi:hypothetical protein
MTPDLWAEGLSDLALAAVSRARDGDVLDAAAALDDLEHSAGRSQTARAIVRRLAADLSRRTRTEMRVETLAGDRLPLAPPDLN